MKLLALDIATATGWAVWDLDRSEGSMQTGCFRCESENKKAEGRKEKRISLRSQLRSLIKSHQPDIIVIEQPLERENDNGRMKEFIAKAVALHNRGAPTSRMLQLCRNFADTKPKGNRVDLVSDPRDEEVRVKGGGNAATQALTRELFSVAWTVSYGLIGDHVHEVQPISWQTVIKGFPGKTTKERSIEACRALRIELPQYAWQKDNAADAAMIAVWAKGHLQSLKLMERVAEASRQLPLERTAA